MNCRGMEANVWSDPEVLKRLKNDYVMVALYVDETTVLPKGEMVHLCLRRKSQVIYRQIKYGFYDPKT